MSGFSSAASAAALALLTGSVACGGGSSAPSTTAPSAVTYTDTFTGTLTQGGSSYGTDNRNHFTIHAAGNITATITKLSPLSTITVGLGLGVYDAATQSCTLQVGNPVTLNVPVSANVGSPIEACVGVVDVGNVGDPIDYEVSVTHT